MNLFIIIFIFLTLYISYLFIKDYNKEYFQNKNFTKLNIDLNSIFNNVNKGTKKNEILDIPIKKIHLSKNNIDVKTKNKIIFSIKHVLEEINKCNNLQLKLLSIESVNKSIYSKTLELYDIVCFIVIPKKYVSRAVRYKFYINNNNIQILEIKTIQDSILNKKCGGKISDSYTKSIYRYAYVNPTVFETNQPHENIPLLFSAPF